MHEATPKKKLPRHMVIINGLTSAGYMYKRLSSFEASSLASVFLFSMKSKSSFQVYFCTAKLTLRWPVTNAGKNVVQH